MARKHGYFEVGQEVTVTSQNTEGTLSWEGRTGVISDFIHHRDAAFQIAVTFPQSQIPEMLTKHHPEHSGVGYFHAHELVLTNRLLNIINVGDPDLAEQIKNLCPFMLTPEHWVLALLWLGTQEFGRNPRAFIGSSYEIYDDEE